MSIPRRTFSGCRATLACALLAALTLLTISAILMIPSATAVINALPDRVAAEAQVTRAALIGQIEATRKDLVSQIEATRTDLLTRSDNQATALRSDVMGEVSEIRKTADRRLGDVLARADVALGTAQGIRSDLGPVLASADSILTHTDQTVIDLRPQILGLTAGWKVVGGETAQTMRDIQRATPQLLTTWQQIEKDVSGSAANINSLTKPRWYDRVLGYALNGVVLYRNLNPVTNLTLSGAQIISSRP